MHLSDTEQGGWHAQTQTQRNCSEWWERSLFSGPNPTWVCSFCLWMQPLVAAHIRHVTCPVLFFFPLYCRTSSERSRTLWWWMRSITCHSSRQTARAKWARWVNKRRSQRCSRSGIVSHLNVPPYFKRFVILPFLFSHLSSHHSMALDNSIYYISSYNLSKQCKQ